MRVSPKEAKFAIKMEPGPHNKKQAVPLGYVLRDLLKIGNTLKEVKYMLNKRKVKVNGKIRTSHKFPVGLFDIIQINGLDESYRMVYDAQGKLVPKAFEVNDELTKISKIVNKHHTKGGKLQLTTNDGFNIITEDNSIKVHDSVLIKLPKPEIVKVIKLEPNVRAVVIAGKHAGEQGIVKEIKPGSETKPRMVVLKTGTKEFEAKIENVMAVGDEL